MDNKAVVHLHSGILFSHKKKEILPFATAWIDLDSIMLSEISQSEKDSHMWNLMNKLNLQANRERLIDGEQADSCWGVGIGMLSWEGGGIEKKTKKKKSWTQQQCGDCGVGGGRGHSKDK